MTCEQASRLLSALVDGELDATETSSVRAHAETCTVCAYEIQVLEGLKGQFHGFDPATPPAGLESRLNEAVFGKPKADVGRWAVVGLLAASSVAAAWLAVRVVGPWEQPSRPNPVKPAVNRASDQAYVTSTDPIDLGAPVVSVGFAGDR
ncbi:MAG: zf-HC2 domain-containing protein [Armatimonadetes bacterium]|nr:zf-HC2 domain-containing protein [Armatimonadota bacterium]